MPLGDFFSGRWLLRGEVALEDGRRCFAARIRTSQIALRISLSAPSALPVRSVLPLGTLWSLAPLFSGDMSYRGLRQHLIDGIVVFLVLHVHEIGDIEKSVALKSDIDERRLHSGKHPRDFPLVDGS